MKKVNLKRNAQIRRPSTTGRQSKVARREEVSGGFGHFKVKAKGEDPIKLMAEAACIVIVSFGACMALGCWLKSKLFASNQKAITNSQLIVIKAKSETRKKAVEQAPRQAEREDPDHNLTQSDKEVKRIVFEKLGLDSEEPLLGEKVYPSDRTSRSKRLPLVGAWLSRGDLGLLVSNPGVGKSAMAYYMADCIAEGRESKLFREPQGHQPPQTVYYFDAEMNSDDMGERYPQGLSESFVRVPIKMPRRNVYYLLKDIIEIVDLDDITSDKTLVIDNIAAAAFKMDVKVLLAGLKSIQAMFEKEGCRLTVLVVVHTTKEAKDRPELEDVAGSADLTRLTTKVLFLNPTEHEGVVRINDGKHRAIKKNKDTVLVRKGGVGTDVNLHFEAAENVMSGEELQKLMDELDDNAPKKPGAPQRLSEEDAQAIAERLDAGEKAEDLSDEFGVCKNTITGRARPYRKGKK